jgi:ABC-type transport system substrate-binding protein
VYGNIYEALLKLDHEMQLQPSLAVEWEPVGEKTWRFTLREGVKFHDGTDFDAEAVKFTFDRVFNPDTPGKGAGYVPKISAVEVVDARTIDITTAEPSGPFLPAMSMVAAVGIVSPSAVEEYGEDYGFHPVGTGPFQFKEWQLGDKIILEQFDGYWGDKAKLDTLVFKEYPEDTARQLAFEKGEIDFLVRPQPALVGALEEDPSATVQRRTGLRLFQVGMKTQDSVFSDVRVRQAANYAVDTQGISEFITEGLTNPARGYLASTTPGFTEAGAYPYDPERAAELLEEAGWVLGDDGIRRRDDEPLEVTFWAYVGRDLKDKEIAEVVQEQLGQVGFNVDLQVYETSVYYGLFWERYEDMDMFMLGWTPLTGDPDMSLFPQLHSENWPTKSTSGWNLSSYENAEVDKLLETGRFSTDADERMRAYQEGLKLVGEDAPWIPIYETTETGVMKDYVKGFETHASEYILWFDKVELDRGD